MEEDDNSLISKLKTPPKYIKKLKKSMKMMEEQEQETAKQLIYMIRDRYKIIDNNFTIENEE